MEVTESKRGLDLLGANGTASGHGEGGIDVLMLVANCYFLRELRSQL